MSTQPLARIPFDSFTLGAVCTEISEFVGGKVQDIRQPSADSVCIGIYAGGREAMLLLCCHAEFARVHFITKRPPNQASPPSFLTALRSRLEGGRLVGVEQVLGDRILDLNFASPFGDFRLIAEIMGKHSNLMLVDAQQKVVAAAKWVSSSKTSRTIQPNAPYRLPPVMAGKGDVKQSPFYRKLAESLEGSAPSPTSPVISHGYGAYPCSVASLGYAENVRASISVALEQHYDAAIPLAEVQALRGGLLTQLRRLLEGRNVALGNLRDAAAAGGKAPEWQRLGELILAYGYSAPLGNDRLDAWDYDGSEIKIPIDPDLDFKSNAEAYFLKAKKAKGRIGFVREQIERVGADAAEIQAALLQIESETTLNRLRGWQETARSKRWVHQQEPVARKKEDRPYEGHRIREALAPGGYVVLYGENAESNDYLTLRVAKPNDIWLHVRGATLAHVVIATRNQPDRVQPETIRYAAKLAVMNSTSKHAGYVPVDYVLRKYVRKPHGAAKGSATYANEKTIHIESDQA